MVYIVIKRHNFIAEYPGADLEGVTGVATHPNHSEQPYPTAWHCSCCSD